MSVPLTEKEEKELGEVVMAPTAWVEGELPTSDYVDARTPEEGERDAKIQSETTTTTADAPGAEPMQMTLEEAIEKSKKEHEELKKRVVKPHNKVSRPVAESDVEKVLKDAYTLRDLCFTEHGLYARAYAMHHAQIESEDPMNFFVLNDGKLIVNPKIIRHTKTTVDSEEGCMTYADLPQRVVERYNKIEVEFQSIEGEEGKDAKLTEIMKADLSGKDAKIWQHEIAHGLGEYVYGKDFAKPELGFTRMNRKGGGIIINKLEVLEEVSKTQ